MSSKPNSGLLPPGGDSRVHLNAATGVRSQGTLRETVQPQRQDGRMVVQQEDRCPSLQLPLRVDVHWWGG